MPDSKFLDQNGLLYVWQKIKLLLSNKVDTVDGKGLSSNDYTGTEKTKLGNIAEGAQVNVIESVTVNGSALSVNNKNVSLTVLTQNDVDSAIDDALAGITGVTFSVVQSLPASGEAGTIYLVSHSHGSADIYDEYIWVNGAFEKIGTTDIDLSGYLQSNATITNAEIDAIFNS